jgi:mRNA interferase RelE/StbE
LGDDPRPAPPLGKKLRAYKNTYRLAVGDWRVVYEVHKREVLVLVIWAGHRRDAYRKR